MYDNAADWHVYQECVLVICYAHRRIDWYYCTIEYTICKTKTLSPAPSKRRLVYTFAIPISTQHTVRESF